MADGEQAKNHGKHPGAGGLVSVGYQASRARAVSSSRVASFALVFFV